MFGEMCVNTGTVPVSEAAEVLLDTVQLGPNQSRKRRDSDEALAQPPPPLTLSWKPAAGEDPARKPTLVCPLFPTGPGALRYAPAKSCPSKLLGAVLEMLIHSGPAMDLLTRESMELAPPPSCTTVEI